MFRSIGIASSQLHLPLTCAIVEIVHFLYRNGSSRHLSLDTAIYTLGHLRHQLDPKAFHIADAIAAGITMLITAARAFAS